MANNQPEHAMPISTMREGDTVLLTGRAWGTRRFEHRRLREPGDNRFYLHQARGGGSYIDNSSDSYGAIISGVDGVGVRRIAVRGDGVSGYVLEFFDDTQMMIDRNGERYRDYTAYSMDRLIRDGNPAGWHVIYEADITLNREFTDEEINKALDQIKSEHGLCEEFDDAIAEANKVPSYLKRLKKVAKKNGEMGLYEELLTKLNPKVWKVGDVVPAHTVIDKFWTGKRTVEGPHMFASFSQNEGTTAAKVSAYDRTIVWIEE